MTSPIHTALKAWCKEQGIRAVTTAQAAELVGVSPDTVRRWRTEGKVLASRSAMFGTTLVPLFTNEDLRRLRTYARKSYPGRRTDLEE